jgi:ankyrin repeat protein
VSDQRNTTPPTTFEQLENPNTQTSQEDTEQNLATPPRVLQRESTNTSPLFSTEQGAMNRLDATNLQIITSTTEIEIPPILTQCVNKDLALCLLIKDFKNVMRLAGVSHMQQSDKLINKIRSTSLMFAAKSGDDETINILLSGVNNPDTLVCMKDENGFTALMLAVSYRQTQSIKALLSGVNFPDAIVRQKNNYGEHALTIAAFENKFTIINLILSAVKNPEELACMRDGEDHTALMYAASFDHHESVTAILSSVSNTKELALMKSPDGYNALMLAAMSGSSQTIQALLDHVKNPNELIFSFSNERTTALMLCVFNIKRKKNMTISENDIYSNKITAILNKVKKVQDINSLISLKDTNGMNAFMLAVEANNLVPALTLLVWSTDKVALFKEKNAEDKTVLDFITKNMCDSLIEVAGELKISKDLKDVDEVLLLLQKHNAGINQSY